ncbi:MAG: DUF1848 domain-containing protein [Clostridiales bacterium]|nr:DUF1848 domain-containing protein [Clostridiales bacterium]
MILSVSRRTDIPRWYMPWLMNRIHAGYAIMQNPMNAGQYFRVDLSPKVVDCIVFWSKDPYPALEYLDELSERGFQYYFQFTLTPYGQDLERFLRPKEEIEKTFIELSGKTGKDRVIWRYDPIILNRELTMEWHKTQFLRMCEKIGAHTDTVTISFVDIYSKLHHAALRSIMDEEMKELAGFIGDTAKRFGLKAVACSESGDFSAYGIGRSACIDRARIEKLLGCALDIPRDKNQRANCGCCQSVDIGAYNTCTNGCIYCYANTSEGAAKRKYEAHDPRGEMLFGTVPENAPIRERKSVSWKTGQLTW